VPNPDNATRTVVIHYYVLNALTFFDDHDELYWNVTGNEWEAPIEHASAKIELPAGVTGLHAVSHSGPFGSRAQDAEVESRGNSVEFRSTHSLEFHEGLTAVVGWTRDLFTSPPQARRSYSSCGVIGRFSSRRSVYPDVLFPASLFVNDRDVMSSHAGSVMTSSSRSSGGSSSSGASSGSGISDSGSSGGGGF
jgi:uncharacterized membrane protein YgcG